MATISSSEHSRRRLPFSSQLRYTLAYVAITLLALLVLNIYSTITTRELMFQSKQASIQSKLQVVVSSFAGIDRLTPDTVDQVITVLGDMGVTRTVITDGTGQTLYDTDGAEAQSVAQTDTVCLALEGNDVFRCVYAEKSLLSTAAMPIMAAESPVGCVYMMETDSEEGHIAANLETNILRVTLILLCAIFVCSLIFFMSGSSRMRKILISMRLVREGEYSHKIQMRGSDEYHMLATEFNKLTDRLQESESAQRQFVSDASHELKTPLASIKLLSDSILQNPMDSETMREFVSDIGNEADRLTRMTQKLLTLSKTEDSREREQEVIDLSDSVSRVFRMLVPLADQRQIELTANVERGCTALFMEDDAYQIIFNLVENGIKYNQDHGSVHVTVKKTEQDVLLTIHDTGVGIPEQALDHIFERFYRVDKARSRQAGGSGLGLSIVKEMVERNYGTIRVSSSENEGSTFVVVFPLFSVDELPPEADPDKQTPD